MSKYKYPGFDKLEEDSVLFRALPLCDILYPFFGERDFGYIESSMFPIELTELILHFLKYEKNVSSELIDSFSKNILQKILFAPLISSYQSGAMKNSTK